LLSAADVGLGFPGFVDLVFALLTVGHQCRFSQCPSLYVCMQGRYFVFTVLSM
jgi:hypothetical protein